MTKYFKYLFLLITFCYPLLMEAQTFSISEIDASKFPKISASFVTLDPLGKSYENLTKADFDVKENGVSMNPSVTVNCIDTNINPAVSIVMVLDQSGSMNELDTAGIRRWDWVLKGAKAFLNTLQFGNGTKVAVVSFGNVSYIRSPFDDNRQALIDSISGIYVSGATRYDPPFLDYNTGAVELFKTQPPTQRRIIVFLTDGNPNNQPPTDSIIKACQGSNIQVYSITLTMEMNSSLAKISEQTGGRSYAVYTDAELNSIYKLIALDIQNKKFCTLNWTSPFGCSESSRNRLTDITFLRLGTRSIRSYVAPPNSIALNALSDQVLFFGDPAPTTSTTADVTISPRSTPFVVNKFSIQPSTYFSVVNWDVGGSGGAPPFTIDTNKPRTIRVQFTQGATLGYRTASLLLDGDPCDAAISLVGGLNQVRILNPEGGEVFSTCDTLIIKWAGVDPTKPVNLSYSTDGGKNWTTIRNNVYGSSYRWNPPAANTNYLIRAVVNTVKSYMWAKNVGSTGNDAASSLAIQNDDLAGYVAGRFEGTVMFDKQMTSRGAQDGFLFKFDTDGNIIWSASMGGAGVDSVAGVVVDGAGNPFIVGTCYSGTQFGSIMPTFPVDNKPYCFVAKYSSAGGSPTVALIGPTTTYPTFQAWGIKIRYAPGNILVQGQYINQGVIGLYTLPKVTTPTFFTATYGDDLTLKYLQQGVVLANDYSVKSDTSSNGNIYNCGYFKPTLNSGSLINTSNGDNDAFFRKYGGTPGSQDTINSPFEVISPSINLTQANIDFGKVTLGYSKDQIIKSILCNTGKKDVNIGSFKITGSNPSDFTLTTNITGSVIKAGECVTLEFNFSPKDVADRFAQLTVYGTCNEVTSLNLQGYGVCSGLVEERVNFGNVSIGMPQVKTVNCAIQNTNPTPVQIDPIISGPNADEFSLNPSGTSILEKDSCYKVQVTFNPKTAGNKVAYIDYRLPTGCETIKTELLGNAFDAAYQVVGVNWYDRKVSIPNDSFVVFNNTSTQIANISSITFEDPTITQFKFGSLKAFPIAVPIGDTLRVPVTFLPDKEGSFNNFVNFKIEALKDPMKAQISGNGVLPKMVTTLDCGTPIGLGDTKTVDLIIFNPSLSSDLTIESISFVDANPRFTFIAGNPSNVVVKKNDQVSFQLTFKPSVLGINSNDIKIKADDTASTGPNYYKTTIFTLACEAEGVVIPPTFDMGAQLQCSETVKKLTLENKSWKSTLRVRNYYFDNTNGDSVAYTVTMPTVTTINPGQSIDVTIKFNPKVVKNWNTKLFFVLDNGDIITTNLVGKSYIVDLYSDAIDEVTVGRAINIMMKGHIENLESNVINTLTVRVKFDPKMLMYINKENVVFKNELGAGWTWQDPVVISDGLLEIKGSGVLNTPFNNKNLFSFWFITYLSDTKETSVNYNHYIQDCNTIDTLGEHFKLKGICFLNGRLIKLTDTHFFMNIPEPNPAGNNSLIKFGVGFKSDVKIDIVNAQGIVIMNAVNQELESGEYDLNVGLMDLSAGVYFIRYSAAGNTVTQKLIKE